MQQTGRFCFFKVDLFSRQVVRVESSCAIAGNLNATDAILGIFRISGRKPGLDDRAVRDSGS